MAVTSSTGSTGGTQSTGSEDTESKSPEPEDQWDEILDAVEHGHIREAQVLLTDVDVAWRARDIQRLSDDAEEYGPLESAGTSLRSKTQGHKDGKISLSDGEKDYLRRAKQLGGDKMDADARKAYNKLMAGQDLSQKEATALYGWLEEVKTTVVPTEKTSAWITEEMGRMKSEYDEAIRTGADRSKNSGG
ncbi:MAG: hypothetical protein HC848_05345 [Limnobacter sp.]|nr:hypothetical protein [Limnobacter sp.]